MTRQIYLLALRQYGLGRWRALLKTTKRRPHPQGANQCNRRRQIFCAQAIDPEGAKNASKQYIQAFESKKVILGGVLEILCHSQSIKVVPRPTWGEASNKL